MVRPCGMTPPISLHKRAGEWVFALLIRAPLLLPLLVLMWLGVQADAAFEWLSPRLPGVTR